MYLLLYCHRSADRVLRTVGTLNRTGSRPVDKTFPTRQSRKGTIETDG